MRPFDRGDGVAAADRVGDEWALTDAGLECPGRGFLLRHSEFPDRSYARSQQDAPPPIPRDLSG